ncbi:hypothetical protein [Methylobacterium nodulans]|uniref:Uncharacterized protein n=1 Tax=Methylobacterium nodulans (strain LMG 21967 / CNCM I-2342 / ORS 2060) TaxID=460265 RepID=B8IDP6_METNO|nr:hypothetical protein [Methylobacterium nodulans]ACL55618.1 conserved hypothetical protein [Methylobacterium nodulans ORS 2060]
MTTVVEGLENATTALEQAVADVLGLKSQLLAPYNQNVTQTTNIVNQFINRSAYEVVWIDEIDGSDTNDGKTADTPKRSLDAAIAAMGMSATEFRLLSDVTLKQKTNLYANVIFSGVQKSAAAPGYIPFNRRMSFLGTAENSPQPGVGTFCAGLFVYTANVQFGFIDFALPDVPAGIGYPYAFSAQAQASFVVYNTTLTVGSPAAGSLFGSILGRVTASLSLVLGTGAAGHVFDGVAAGGNPNLAWKYDTNITSA